jgi:hypothetical protein
MGYGIYRKGYTEVRIIAVVKAGMIQATGTMLRYMGGGYKMLIFSTTRGMRTLFKQRVLHNLPMRIILHHKVSYVCF